MSALWERVFEAGLKAWFEGSASGLRLSRLPSGAWPLVAGALARAAAARGRSLLVLAPGPERVLAELRPWRP